MSLRAIPFTLALCVGALCLASCKSADEGLLPNRMTEAGTGGAGGSPITPGVDGGRRDGSVVGGMDGSVTGDGAVPSDGCAANVELCNGVDDNCNGDIDEGADDACALVIPHARSTCEQLGNDTFCLNRGCLDGYFNCDGLNENGCEPWCDCHICADAGADDAGSTPPSASN